MQASLHQYPGFHVSMYNINVLSTVISEAKVGVVIAVAIVVEVAVAVAISVVESM